jgi:hypothetical protein
VIMPPTRMAAAILLPSNDDITQPFARTASGSPSVL